MAIKETGVVRRIDDLGRVVIPKEFRRAMHIQEGDPFELLIIDDKTVGFRKNIDSTTLKEAKTAAFTLKHMFSHDKFTVYDQTFFNDMFTEFFKAERINADIQKAMDDYNKNRDSGTMVGCWNKTIIMPLYNEGIVTCLVVAETDDINITHISNIRQAMETIASFIKYESR